MALATDPQPLLLMKAHRHAETSGCPRCRSGIFIERLYHEAMTIHQFRCMPCGWRDDVRFMAVLTEREFERQERRALTEDAKGFSGKITED